MKLDFQSITLESFGCFRAAQTMSFEGRSPGLYFLTGKNPNRPRLGPNGVGKTTIWRALTWALYGKTASGLRTPDLQPWRGKKLGPVSISLNGDTITRTTNPNQILINNQAAEQADIDKLLGSLSLEALSNTIAMAQGEDLFLDLPPKSKLDLLSDALQLERWEERARRAGKTVNTGEQEANQLNGVIAGLNTALDRTEQLLKASQAQAREWEDARQKRLEGQEEHLKELTIRVDEALNRLGKAQRDRDSYGLKLREMDQDIQRAQQELSKVQSKVAVSNSTVKQLAKQCKSLRDELAGQWEVCPTCGQKLRDEGRAQHKAALTKEIANLTRTIKAQTAILNEHESSAAVLEGQVEGLTALAIEAQQKADKAEMAVNLYTTEHTRLRTELNLLHEQRAEDRVEANPYTDQVSKLRRQLSQSKTEIAQKEQQLGTLLTQVERTKFWVKGFRDVGLFLIEEVLQEVEVTCNAMLPDVGLDGWEMFFDVERETAKGSVQRGLSVWVRSPDNDKPVRWECWSGGEGQRLRIIGALALSEVLLAHAGIQTNLEVLDEPTQHLSAEGTRDLCAFLADRAKTIGRQTWWVDHNMIQSNRFSGTITVVRTKQGSQIEDAV